MDLHHVVNASQHTTLIVKKRMVQEGRDVMFENGSEIMAVDFHLHTNKDKEFQYKGEDNSFVKEYVDAFEDKGIRIGVITNHNKFDLGEYRGLRDATRKKDILILPGVELSVKEGASGLHTLIIFDPTSWIHDGSEDINKFLDSVFPGINNRESSNTRCRCDLSATIDTLDQYNKDYFIVIAHVDQANGIFEECSGGMLSSLADEIKLRKRVLGVQKVRNWDRFNKLPPFWKTHIARVEGSDPKNISDVGKTGCRCYIELGELSFGALKYALADHTNRVYHAIPTVNHGYIKGISFEGGRLDGQYIGLSSRLNTMIGIRGSGKSSILEVLRYALAIEPSQDAIYKSELVKHVIGSGGKVSLSVVDEHGFKYRIERINGERPRIVTYEGTALSLEPNAILRNPLYFGQKDLSMSKPGYELELLNKLAGDNIPSNDSALQEAITALVSNLRQYSDLRTLPERISELEAKDRELEHKLKVFEEKGITERLEKQTAYKTDVAKLSGIIKSLSEVISAYSAFVDKYDTAGIQLVGYTSKYNESTFEQVHKIINSVSVHVATMTKHSLGLDEDKRALEALYKALLEATDALREEFAQIKREIADDNIDLEGFEKYQNERLSVRDSISRLNRNLGAKDGIQRAVAEGFRIRNEMLRKTYLAYQKEIERINGGQAELQISIQFKGNKPVFVEQLRSIFKGTHVNETKYTRLSEIFSDMAAIVEDYYLNNGAKIKEVVSDRESSLIFERIETSFSDYVAEQCPDLVQIMYHGKELSKHSMGQRASALMLFILSQDDNDIVIIDQPEDDLDNQVVYTEFIKTLRAKKTKAQYIFATHNANIPVLGDAEKVIAAQYLDRSIELTMGSIDTPEAHKKIVDIMEGGYEAFQRRNAIYTSWQ